MKEKLNVNRIPALKQAILDLTEKEKNQLLIRLINKDQLLIEQLHFKLLENEFDLIQRFEDLKTVIITELNQHYSSINKVSSKYRGQQYLRLIRQLSSKITHFSKVTKSIAHEVELRLMVLIESSKLFENVQNENSVIGYKIRVYQVSKIKSILTLMQKLHEDLIYDLTLTYSKELESYVFNSLQVEIKAVKLNIELLKTS